MLWEGAGVTERRGSEAENLTGICSNCWSSWPVQENTGDEGMIHTRDSR